MLKFLISTAGNPPVQLELKTSYKLQAALNQAKASRSFEDWLVVMCLLKNFTQKSYRLQL